MHRGRLNMWVCMLKGGGGDTGDDYVSWNLTAPSHTSKQLFECLLWRKTTHFCCKEGMMGGKKTNSVLCCVCVSVCPLTHACLCVQHTKGGKNLENKVLFTKKRKRKIPPVNREKNDILKWAMTAERLRGGQSCSERPETLRQHWQAVWCRPSKPCPHPSPILISLVLHLMSHWIFSHSPTLKTLLTATVRERQSEENECSVCVMWFFWAPGYANQTVLVKHCEQRTKKE